MEEEEISINIPLSEENLEILHSKDEKKYLDFMGWTDKPDIITVEMKHAELYGINWIDHLFMLVDEKMSDETDGPIYYFKWVIDKYKSMIEKNNEPIFEFKRSNIFIELDKQNVEGWKRIDPFGTQEEEEEEKK